MSQQEDSVETKMEPASDKSPTRTLSGGLISSISKPSTLVTTTSSKSITTKSSRRISLRGSRRKDAVEKAIAAWNMDSNRTLGAKLSITQLEELHDIFKQTGRSFNKTGLKKTLESLNIRLDDDVLDLTFLKMETTLDGDVSWDEFISFLLIELVESQDIGEPQEDMLRPPIASDPEVFNARHRHPVIRMTFVPEVSRDRSASYLHGKFVTVSKEGSIHFWTMGMKHEKAVTSGSALLKVRPTWVTDLVAMPDINIIATSSTERELRFYDTTANKWELRVLIWGMDQPVLKMHYHFSQSASDDSCLILGDTGGNIRVLLFDPYRKGPFRQQLGCNVVSVRFEELLKGTLPGLRVVEFLNVHSEWVRQVSYYLKSNSFISCAPCPKTSVLMCDIYGTKSQYRYNVPGGVTCFCVAEGCVKST